MTGLIVELENLQLLGIVSPSRQVSVFNIFSVAHHLGEKLGWKDKRPEKRTE